MADLGDLESTVVIRVDADTNAAGQELKTFTKTVENEFGEVTRTITRRNMETGEVTKKIFKENELFVNKLGDLAKTYSAGLLAAGLAAKGFQVAFELAVGAAKRAGDEGSKRFLDAYNEMGKATERFKDAVGTALMPALTNVSRALADIADRIGAIVSNKWVQRAITAGSELGGYLPGGTAAGQAGVDAAGRIMYGGGGYGISAGIRGGLGQFAGGMKEAAATDYLNRITPGVVAQMEQGAADAIWKGSERDYLRRLSQRGGGGGGGYQFSGVVDPVGQRAVLGATQDAELAAILERTQSEWGARDAFRDDQSKYGDWAQQAQQGIAASGVTDADWTQINQALDSLALLQADKGQSALSKVFGPIEEFDLYAKGFQMLEGATQAAFSAWIDGTQAVSQALAEFGKAMVKNLAMEMASQAVRHAAHAIGNLALGWASMNPVTAGKHFTAAAMHGKAAAAFGIGAALFGAGAKALGGEGGGGGGGVGAGPSVAGIRGGGGGGQPADRNVTIILSDSWSDDSPRMRRARLSKAISAAVREDDR